MDEGQAGAHPRIRRRIGIAALLAGGVVLAGVVAGWVERKPIVAHFVDDALNRAQVPASYRLAAIGPFAQVLKDVRIGPAAAPDLTARSITVHLGYGWSGPYLAGIDADGVRLKAKVADGRLSLGAIDRLLPQGPSAGPPALPDIMVRLSDARVALGTPAGAVTAAAEGRGNLSDGFHGTLSARAPRLSAGGCTLDGLAATMEVRVEARRPRLTGPVTLAALACPRRALRLGAGRAVIDARMAAALDSARGGVSLSGLGGRAGAVRFAGLSGLVTGTADARQVDGTTGITVTAPSAAAGKAEKVQLGGTFRYLPPTSALAFQGDATFSHAALAPARRKALVDAARALDGSPLAPLAARLGEAADRLLSDADAAAHLSLTAGGPGGTQWMVRTLALAGRGGGFVRMEDEGAGFGWQARGGLRADGRLAMGGGGLPALDVELRQAAAGAPLGGTARMAPYAADGARLAMTPLRFRIGDDGATRFDTVLTLDGPLPSGRISGLAVPLAGRVAGDGGFAVGEGCETIGFRALVTGGMRLDPGRLRLCGVDGAPMVSRPSGGTLRYGAQGRALKLTGRSGDAPLSVAADSARISAEGLSARGLAVRIGAGDALTRLGVANLDGRYRGGVLGGPFDGASAQIGHVPLLLDKMAGDWEFAGGALVLNGSLTVSDSAPAPRFLPLIARDATLRFGDGRIDAAAKLREPKSDAAISDVDIHHDLASGAGYATLDVPGVTFAPKGLQPEALTPLTLGVIANVNGTLRGQGRIDWNAAGVTSTGDFATDGTDFAAAFGPVSKVAGSIHFSDLLALETPPHQTATVQEVNPGVAVSNGIVHYQLLPGQKVKVEGAHWPFAGGTLDLEPTLLDFDQHAERHLTFTVKSLDAAAFVQQLDMPNISATGTFDGTLPMIFDQSGGRIAGGMLKARAPGGTLAYVGNLTTAQIGTMGKLAFDALKAIRYDSLSITLDGRLDGEIVSGVKFAGVRQATGDGGIVGRAIVNLPFRFNIMIRAPFRGLLGSARAFVDPSVVLANGVPVAPAEAAQVPAAAPAIQPAESEPMR